MWLLSFDTLLRQPSLISGSRTFCWYFFFWHFYVYWTSPRSFFGGLLRTDRLYARPGAGVYECFFLRIAQQFPPLQRIISITSRCRAVTRNSNTDRLTHLAHWRRWLPWNWPRRRSFQDFSPPGPPGLSPKCCLCRPCCSSSSSRPRSSWPRKVPGTSQASSSPRCSTPQVRALLQGAACVNPATPIS